MIVSAVCIVPYLIGGMPLPRTEGFDFSIIPLKLYAEQLFSGESSLWFHSAGLGIPWPIPHSMTHTPFLPLFALLQPLSALALTLFFHLVIMGIYFQRLCLEIGINRSISIVCVLTIIIAPPLEYLYWSDAPAVFLGWCLLPIFLYYSWRLIVDKTLKEAIISGIWLGTVVGYAMLNSHSGVFSTYVIGVTLFVLAKPQILYKRLGVFFISILVASLLSADKWFFFISELQYFPNNVPRFQQETFGSPYSFLWNAFIKPFVWPFSSGIHDWHDLYIHYFEKNRFSRTIGFGSVFTFITVFFAPKLIKDKPISKGLYFGFLGCLLLIFCPKELLPNFISASWTFRDPLCLYGVLLAGLTLQELSTRSINMPVNKILIAQTLVMLLGSAPFLLGPVFLENSDSQLVSQYNALMNKDEPSRYIQLLRKVTSSDGVSSGRILHSSSAAYAIENDKFIDVGAINNVAAYHGLTEVSFLTKGISLDVIAPSPSVPYGRITGERLKYWRLLEQPNEWVTQDQALLSLLGIEAVVATKSDIVSAPFLKKYGELTSLSGDSLIIYRNMKALPAAILMPERYETDEMTKRDSCDGNHLICVNFSNFVNQLNDDAEQPSVLLKKNGSLVISIKASNKVQNILLTSMYRPAWQAQASHGENLKVNNFNGLLRVTIPKGVSSLEMVYNPIERRITKTITLLSIILLMLFLFARIYYSYK
ncbi:MAG: hypothetical protein GQ475_01900 [Methylococcaceae bacterium]|nr:hypothetical protein [Methylococcaceae bacterium]